MGRAFENLKSLILTVLIFSSLILTGSLWFDNYQGLSLLVSSIHNNMIDKLVNDIFKEDSKHMPVMFKSQKFSPFSYTDTVEQGTYGNFYDLYYTNPYPQAPKNNKSD